MKLRCKECLSKAMLLQTALLCLLTLAAMGWVMYKGGELFDYFYCLATLAFVCLPAMMSLVFRWRFNEILYTVFSLYAMGPLLGAVFGLYSTLPWWDDLLHGLAGVLFAVCGMQLAYTVNRKGQTSYLMAAVFGVMVSMAIAVFWEIYEFGADVLLGSDMQTDRIVNAIHSKLLSGTENALSIHGITDVVINGESLGMGGYMDIGLYDTMLDMMVETAGALVFFVYVLLDRNRHPMIRSLKTT